MKNWLSSVLFEECIQDINQRFGVKKRKIALVIDNCKAHPHVENLEWVKLVFLPPSTTSVTQRMDQRIIHDLKKKYWSLVVRQLISSLEKKLLCWLSKVWMTPSDETFRDYFRKCGVSEEAAAKDDMEVREAESIRKPLIEAVGKAIEILEEFSFYSDFWEGIL